MIREFGHSKEGNAKPAANYEDEKKELFIANEKNITLYANYRAISVKTDGNRIESVIIKHIENGKEVELKAPLFSDCTGDGTIGYLAGADYNMGRESRTEYGEELAPIQPDKMTMVHPYNGTLQTKVNLPVSLFSRTACNSMKRIAKK